MRRVHRCADSAEARALVKAIDVAMGITAFQGRRLRTRRATSHPTTHYTLPLVKRNTGELAIHMLPEIEALNGQQVSVDGQRVTINFTPENTADFDSSDANLIDRSSV